MADDDGGPAVHGDFMILRGTIIERVPYAGTKLEMKPVFAIEKEPGGQFLYAHSDEDAGLDFAAYLGQVVEIEGELWTTQAVTISRISRLQVGGGWNGQPTTPARSPRAQSRTGARCNGRWPCRRRGTPPYLHRRR